MGVVIMLKRKKLTEEQIEELRSFIKDKKSSGKEIRRGQAILMLNDWGDDHLIKNLTDFDKKYVFKLKNKYLKNGLVALRSKKRKSRALLTKSQIKEIVKIIQTKTPKDLGIDCDFWTTSILADFIKEKYNVEYKSKTSLYIIFKEAKFTYHKPGQKYHKSNPENIEKWKEKNKPQIERALKDNNTVVLAGDEMILSTQTTFQKIWLPVNNYPKIDISSKRQKRFVYGFLNVKNGNEIAFKTKKMNSEETCKILKKLGAIHKGKKIMLVWDNAPWHRSEITKEFLKKTEYDFHLIQFPPYAPEENAQEHVWKEGRSKITHNKFIENIDKATNDFVAYLNNTNFNYKFLGF